MVNRTLQERSAYGPAEWEGLLIFTRS